MVRRQCKLAQSIWHGIKLERGSGLFKKLPQGYTFTQDEARPTTKEVE